MSYQVTNDSSTGASNGSASFSWRRMAAGDLDAVAAIARSGFPHHFEGRDIFANRLAIYPAGCFVLAGGSAAPVGYLIAYPWTRGDAPPLNSSIVGLPQQSDAMYLHDLALHPQVRGGGHPRAIIDLVVALCRKDGWPIITLVAVNDAARFWERHGFYVIDTEMMRPKLASYGADARYMVRELP